MIEYFKRKIQYNINRIQYNTIYNSIKGSTCYGFTCCRPRSPEPPAIQQPVLLSQGFRGLGFRACRSNFRHVGLETQQCFKKAHEERQIQIRHGASIASSECPGSFRCNHSSAEIGGGTVDFSQAKLQWAERLRSLCHLAQLWGRAPALNPKP